MGLRNATYCKAASRWDGNST